MAVRVVYVLYPDPGPRPLAEVLDRWPTAPATLAALARGAGGAGFEAVAVLRAGSASSDEPEGRGAVVHGCAETTRRANVTFRSVVDRSRLGWRLAWAVRRQRPDVVHQNGFLFPLQTALLRLVIGSRVPIVVQHHGERPDAVGPRRWRLARRAVAAALFTGGEAQAAPWRACGVLTATHPVHDVLEASTDLRAPGQRDVCRLTTAVHGDPAVLWVGRLQAGKDPELALEAFARFAEHHPAARLWMLCTEAVTAPAAALQATIEADERLAERVVLTGPVAHEAMGAWFGSCELFLTTSRHEGSGFALIEAIACGCTPVWSDLPPHRSIATRAGWLGAATFSFPVGDAEAAATALRQATAACREHPAHGTDGTVAVTDGAGIGWDRVASELQAAYLAAIGSRR